MRKRWWFIECTRPRPARWSWRIFSLDGAIAEHAQEFDSYGAAMWDAMMAGFSPTRDQWVIESAHAVTYYEHGQGSIVIAKSSGAILLAPRRVSPSPAGPVPAESLKDKIH